MLRHRFEFRPAVQRLCPITTGTLARGSSEVAFTKGLSARGLQMSEPPPAFPAAHSYGGLSPTTEMPNPYDLSHRFNSLNIAPESPSGEYVGDWRRFPVRQNSDVNKPLPSIPTPSAASPTRPPIPNVLTPGSRYGLMQSEAQSPSIDYLPPLRNPVPRPPQMVPRRDDFGLDPYSMTPYAPPITIQAHSAPPNASLLTNSWSNQPLCKSTPSKCDPLFPP